MYTLIVIKPTSTVNKSEHAIFVVYLSDVKSGHTHKYLFHQAPFG